MTENEPTLRTVHLLKHDVPTPPSGDERTACGLKAHQSGIFHTLNPDDVNCPECLTEMGREF